MKGEIYTIILSLRLKIRPGENYSDLIKQFSKSNIELTQKEFFFKHLALRYRILRSSIKKILNFFPLTILFFRCTRFLLAIRNQIFEITKYSNPHLNQILN
jgi:hypothetical protein